MSVYAVPEWERVGRAIEEAQRLVIEAAKTWAASQDNDSARLLVDAVNNLKNAEALR